MPIALKKRLYSLLLINRLDIQQEQNVPSKGSFFKENIGEFCKDNGISGYVSLSTKTGANIDEAHGLIANTLSELDLPEIPRRRNGEGLNVVNYDGESVRNRNNSCCN